MGLNLGRCFLKEDSPKRDVKKQKKLLIEKNVEFIDTAITRRHWEAAGEMADLPDEDTARLIEHILMVKFKKKGKESVIALQERIANFLYPDPKMLSWGERQLKRNPGITPAELAYKYAKAYLKNVRMGPSLIRDMQKLKVRVQMRDKRKEWADASGYKIRPRMKTPKPRIPANAAYFEKVIESRFTEETN